MAKFNVVQKRRRALVAEKKRLIHGDPSTGKLKIRKQPVSLSGKRKRKLFKQWRREQKDALENGLVSMEDVQMAVAEAERCFVCSGCSGEEGRSFVGGAYLFCSPVGSSVWDNKDNSATSSAKFHLKKGLKLKQLKRKGKNKRKSDVPAAEISADAMME